MSYLIIGLIGFCIGISLALWIMTKRITNQVHYIEDKESVGK
jgi:hypothetical protein